MSDTFTVTSSHGSFVALKYDGSVKKILIDNCQDCRRCNYDKIDTFDVGEYKKYYNVETVPDNIDILDIGYRIEMSRGVFIHEEPEHDWRQETAELRKQGAKDLLQLRPEGNENRND